MWWEAGHYTSKAQTQKNGKDTEGQWSADLQLPT